MFFPVGVINLILTYMVNPTDIGRKLSWYSDILPVIDSSVIMLLIELGHKKLTHSEKWVLTRTIPRLEREYQSMLSSGCRLYIPYKPTPKEGKRLIWAANATHDKIIVMFRHIFPGIPPYDKVKLKAKKNSFQF